MIFAQAVKEHIFLYNIADTATPPKVDRREAEFFELEEVLSIREALQRQPLKWQAIVSLLIDTGARRAEILGLKWDDIDFANNQIIYRGIFFILPREGYLRIRRRQRRSVSHES
jgi:integrase